MRGAQNIVEFKDHLIISRYTAQNMFLLGNLHVDQGVSLKEIQELLVGMTL